MMTLFGIPGSIRLAAIGLAVAVGGGCVHYYEPAPSPPPVVVRKIAAPGRADDPAVMSEIDAAAHLAFESRREAALRTIARRPDLSPAVQVYLVNTIYRTLSFDSKRRDLLLDVIDNPSFSAPAKESILLQLNHLAFERNKERILAALDARGPIGGP